MFSIQCVLYRTNLSRTTITPVLATDPPSPSAQSSITSPSQALFDVGKLLEAKDVVHFIKNTSMYEPYYLLWIELNRPQKVGPRKETWDMFHKAVWNIVNKRKDSDGQQTEDTGN